MALGLGMTLFLKGVGNALADVLERGAGSSVGRVMEDLAQLFLVFFLGFMLDGITNFFKATEEISGAFPRHLLSRFGLEWQKLWHG
jgi:hypothetical protein